MLQSIMKFPVRGRILALKTDAARQFVNWLTAAYKPADCHTNRLNRSVNFLRWGIGFIYLWFGALKFFPHLSSAEGIAGATIEMMAFEFVTPHVSLPLLALWETGIGLALLTGKFQRTAILSLFLHNPSLTKGCQTWKLKIFHFFEGKYWAVLSLFPALTSGGVFTK